MINFIIGLYRNPPPGALCYNPKIHRYTECISGLPREIVVTFLIVASVVSVAILLRVIIEMILDR